MTSTVVPRLFWSDDETKLLLTVIKEKNILKLFKEKTYRREQILKIIEKEFHAHGFIGKNIVHIDNKWKNLKKLYRSSKQANYQNDGNTSNLRACPYYSQLDKILTPHNSFEFNDEISNQSTISQSNDSKMEPTKCAEIFYIDGHLKYVCFFCTTYDIDDIHKFEEHLYSTHLNALQLEDNLSLSSHQENDNKIPIIHLSVETLDVVDVLDEFTGEIPESNNPQNYLEIERDKEYISNDELIESETSESEKSFGIIEMSSDANFICDYCNMEFPSYIQLKKHIWKFQKLKFKCSQCEKQMCGPRRCKRHMKFHTNYWNSQRQQKQQQPTIETDSLSDNVQSRISKSIRKSSDKLYTCDICKIVCKEIWNLKTHMRLHTGEKPFACNKCDRRFNENSALKMHFRHHHTNERPYLCTECGSSYGFLRTLNAHIRRAHIKFSNGPQPCPICKKYFENNVRLKIHMKTHEKPYPCIHCDKAFTNRKGLRVHLKLHA